MGDGYRYVRWLADCADLDSPEEVGGKAVGLGRLCRLHLPVPPGFAVGLAAYRDFITRAGLGEVIEGHLSQARGPDGFQIASERIAEAFRRATPTAELVEEVEDAYRRLAPDDDLPVAVRSSANAEDMADASFAGQQETFLWVMGADRVVEHVVRCWASLFTPQAIAYRSHLGRPADHLGMGVVVQQMVSATAAGVMITLDPVTGDPSQVSIEACHGLGVGVVNGEVTPDRYFVDKVTGELRSKTIASKPEEFRFDPTTGSVEKLPVEEERRDEPALTDSEVRAIAELGVRIERALGGPQDVEWTYGPGEPDHRDLYLLQTRPETVWSQKRREPIAPPGSTVMDRILMTISRPIKLKET